MSGRIEIVGRVSGRRRWTVEQKLAILRNAFAPQGSVRAAVERHEVGSGAIYTKRRQAMSGALSGGAVPVQPSFVEVQITESAAMASAPDVARPGRGRIRIELPSGVRLLGGRRQRSLLDGHRRQYRPKDENPIPHGFSGELVTRRSLDFYAAVAHQMATSGAGA